MAIARGAGTEIIRSAMFEDVDDNWTTLIVGVQHHIYTVLSIVAHASTLATAGNRFKVRVVGYDAKAGDTGNEMLVFNTAIGATHDTFVWNDKFSFNGTEPTDFGSPPLSTVAEQDLIADQATATSQS